MKYTGKIVAYLAVATLLVPGSLSIAWATPIAYRIHSTAATSQQFPEEGPLNKEEKKALKKQERAERKAELAAKRAEQAEQARLNGTSDRTRAGWRMVYLPGYGYQTVYFDAFGYPSHDIMGRPLYLSGFGSPYYYRPIPRRVVVRPCPPAK